MFKRNLFCDHLNTAFCSEEASADVGNRFWGKKQQIRFWINDSESNGLKRVDGLLEYSEEGCRPRKKLNTIGGKENNESTYFTDTFIASLMTAVVNFEVSVFDVEI